MNDKFRRILGALLGAGMGLAYALVALNINSIALPGIPLYQPPPGKLANFLATIVLGGLLGLIAAWPEDAIPGVLSSALAGILVTSLFNIFLAEGQSGKVAGALIVLFLTFLPRAVLFLPMAIITRWALSYWANVLRDVNFSIKKLALSLAGILALSGLIGVFSLYPAPARQALQTTNALVRQGIQAATPESLPQELKPLYGFPAAAGGAYTLRLSNDPDSLPITRPIAAYTETEYAVLVLFENGYRFACVFSPTDLRAYCGNY